MPSLPLGAALTASHTERQVAGLDRATFTALKESAATS